jgi:hypothetical protein
MAIAFNGGLAERPAATFLAGRTARPGLLGRAPIMAARSEHQGLQIALIIFVMLTIILSVTTFMFFKESEKATAKSAEDMRGRQEADAGLRKALDEQAELKRAIGVAEGDSIETVRETVNNDMRTWAGTFPEPKQSYRECMVALLDSYRAADDERKKEREELTAMKARVDALEIAKDNTLKEQQNQATTAASQLTDATTKFAAADKAHVEEKATLAEQKKKVEEEKDALAKESDAQIKSLNDRLRSTVLLNEGLNEKVEGLTATTFEVSDGEIRWVNQRNGTVWINLGRADSLPKQMPFSVFGRAENDVARTESKAKIEVTQILGDHLAEARIVEDYIADPILPGDKIFTPLWHPGRAEHFAIAGKIDLNDDGISEKPMIKDLLALNGAVLDAEMTDEGKIVGPGMTIETRYLITGEAPTDKAGQAVYAKMESEAKTLGIKLITIEKFLDHMGWKDPNRLVEFGKYSNEKQFPPITTDKVKPRTATGGATSGVFKKRHAREAAPAGQKPTTSESAYE